MGRERSSKQQRNKLHEGIARGEQAVASARTPSHADARARMARWLKVSDPALPEAVAPHGQGVAGTA